MMERLLDNYRQLVARVDTLCRNIRETLGQRITCSEGCSTCCTTITVFPVEAASLATALKKLPNEEAEAIRRHVIEQEGRHHCPLLVDNLCLLYAARPIICRTHGLPVVYTEEGERLADCCPLNPTEGETLTGNAIVDLDKLNALLVAVNSLYVSQSGAEDQPERLTIAEALLGVSQR